MNFTSVKQAAVDKSNNIRLLESSGFKATDYMFCILNANAILAQMEDVYESLTDEQKTSVERLYNSLVT